MRTGFRLLPEIASDMVLTIRLVATGVRQKSRTARRQETGGSIRRLNTCRRVARGANRACTTIQGVVLTEIQFRLRAGTVSPTVSIAG